MKNYSYLFGVDISKKIVDIALLHEQKMTHKKFSNDPSGMAGLLEWLNSSNLSDQNTLFCMEATGLYCCTLNHFLAEAGIDVWVEHPASIKIASGISRGKNDKVDSQRIALYCSKNLDRLRLWKPMDSTIEQIRHLATLRERLVETQKRLLTPINEFEEAGNSVMAKMLLKTIKKTVIALEADLKSVEAKIIDIVNSDENLKKLYRIVTSVVGIGFVTAINLMVHTNGFKVLKRQSKACMLLRCGAVRIFFGNRHQRKDQGTLYGQ